MPAEFSEIKPESLKINPFGLIGADWMLITAGTRKSFNSMTASWGGMGVLWDKNICLCVIRPVRHTYSFIEKSGRFTLSFFDDVYRDLLLYCGTHSGRDVDKIKETGLTPVFDGEDLVYYEEARLVIELKKIYFQDIVPANFMDPAIDGFYPEKDFHRMYAGEIIRCLEKKS